MAFATGPIPIQGLTRPDDMRNPSVVALGGGHGLSASLSALRRLTTELTAVVTVADDGGSSGRLRGSFDVLPPGDLRMALAALCDDNDWGRTWRDVMQHRFKSDEHPEEPLNGHAVGNLLILALWELLDNPVAGLRWAGALLGARGQVLPMSTVPLSIHGEVLEADEVTDTLIKRRIDGQARLAAAGGGDWSLTFISNQLMRLLVPKRWTRLSWPTGSSLAQGLGIPRCCHIYCYPICVRPLPTQPLKNC